MKASISLALFLATTLASHSAFCQGAEATLSGTTSKGNGGATVAFDGATLKTDIYFANLDTPSKGAYILCCNKNLGPAVPATANLIEKSAGMDHGSSVVNFDTNQTGFWNSTFSGGDVALARSRLEAALAAGEAHIIVTSESDPDVPGEIRGTFTRTGTIAAKGAPSDRATLKPPNLITMRTAPGEPYGYYQFPPSGGKPVKITAAGGNDFKCSGDSERCVFPVYVSSTYVDGIAVRCEARVDYGVISVPPHKIPGKQIRVVWQIVEGDVGDTGDYRFMDAGIELTANQPRQDFNGKGRESADGKRFKWLRVGARTGVKIDYKAWVERFDPATGRSLGCKPADPMIANTN